MKERTKMEKIMGFAALILSLVLVLGTAFVFHACGPKDDGTYMNCHNAQNAVVVTGIVLTILQVLALAIHKKHVEIVFRLLTVAGSVFAALLPQTIIHLCMMNSMRCQAVMKPSVILVSALLAIVSVVSLILAAKRKVEK